MFIVSGVLFLSEQYYCSIKTNNVTALYYNLYIDRHQVKDYYVSYK